MSEISCRQQWEQQSSLLLKSNTAAPQGTANVFNYVTEFFLESSPYLEIMANHAKSIWKCIFFQSCLRAHISESFKHEKHMPKALVLCFTVALTTQLWDTQNIPPNSPCGCSLFWWKPKFLRNVYDQNSFCSSTWEPLSHTILPHPGLIHKKARLPCQEWKHFSTATSTLS